MSCRQCVNQALIVWPHYVNNWFAKELEALAKGFIALVTVSSNIAFMLTCLKFDMQGSKASSTAAALPERASSEAPQPSAGMSQCALEGIHWPVFTVFL